MRTRNRSFQLEQTIPGTFLLQGWLGGILAGFIYIVAICLWEDPTSFTEPLSLMPYMFVFTSVLGVIKATLIWLPYRLKRFQPRAATRVAICSVWTALLAVATWLTYSNELTELAAWASTLLLGGLPTAMLIGSRVKPWDLFTFGSIGGERVRSVWGTLGTLPLRFLSLIALALWILLFAIIFDLEQWQIIVREGVVFIVPAAYLLFSTWVTFRSPDKAVLFVVGCSLNVLLTVLGIFAYVRHTERVLLTQFFLLVSVICASFVICWTLFLIARLCVRTGGLISILSTHSLPRVVPRVEQPDHHCLGSRFMEWQERHAQ